MTESTQVDFHAQPTSNNAVPYHKQAHVDLNHRGILASCYAFILHSTRTAARVSLTADAAVYKSCDKAIEAIDALTVA